MSASVGGRAPPGLEVGDEDAVVADQQPVDRARDDRAAGHHRRDRRLGQRLGPEQIGEGGIGDDPAGVVGQRRAQRRVGDPRRTSPASARPAPGAAPAPTPGSRSNKAWSSRPRSAACALLRPRRRIGDVVLARATTARAAAAGAPRPAPAGAATREELVLFQLASAGSFARTSSEPKRISRAHKADSAQSLPSPATASSTARYQLACAGPSRSRAPSAPPI